MLGPQRCNFVAQVGHQKLHDRLVSMWRPPSITALLPSPAMKQITKGVSTTNKISPRSILTMYQTATCFSPLHAAQTMQEQRGRDAIINSIFWEISSSILSMRKVETRWRMS